MCVSRAVCEALGVKMLVVDAPQLVCFALHRCPVPPVYTSV